jgi:HD-GYP domain-containing protein (c-di-GMP phosphodiesterase class II)
MTSTRPYRPGLRRADAVRELERCAGTQFDPEVVDAFIATVEPRSLATA